MELEELLELAKEKLLLGNELIQKLKSLEHIDGVKKVQRKIGQEIKFIEKVIKNKSIQKNHILCSNLTHFQSLVKALFKFNKNLRHVDYPIPISETDKTLRIDIVADSGATWVKVIARNPKSIKETVAGMGSYGAKTILDQAEEILEAAQLNPYLYQAPRVIFLFVNPIDLDLQKSLQDIGVDVQDFNDELATEKIEITTLNLDVTTLIAYVSALTNDGNAQNCDFGSDFILNQQVQMELRNPIKPKLDELFQGKRLICSETAVKSFRDIVKLLGGPGEQKRAEELLSNVEILPDVDDQLCVNVSGQVKERSLKIFSFGIFHKAINVTSNEGFYRSMKMQGIDLPVFLHEARALTELKEQQKVA